MVWRSVLWLECSDIGISEIVSKSAKVPIHLPVGEIAADKSFRRSRLHQRSSKGM